MLRTDLLRVLEDPSVRKTVSELATRSGLVARFVGGGSVSDAIEVASGLVDRGLLVSLDHLGENVTSPSGSGETVVAYEEMLRAAGAAGLAPAVEASVKPSALGLTVTGAGQELFAANLERVAAAAAAVGATVTVDMETYPTVEDTLETVGRLRQRYIWLGVAVQSYLYRTERDCRDLADSGARVRLCKGAYRAPILHAYQSSGDIERAFVRCGKLLTSGDAFPMYATHDSRLLAIAEHLADRYNRGRDSYELQMLYGVRTDEQRRLAAMGRVVRVYVPYGSDWYGYLSRRIVEHPYLLRMFARAVFS